MENRAQKGFTLIELIVVVLIIGILAAFSIPQYLKTVETTKADDSSALMNMVGIANRMYALDHTSTYLSGQLSNASCNTGAACGSTAGSVCNLLWCNYLSSQDWDGKPYNICASANTSCPSACGSFSGSNVACVSRKTTGTNSTTISPYKDWGYSMDVNNVITPQGAAPTSVQ